MRRRGRPVLGGISGILLGAFVAIDLQQFAVRPFDNLTVIGLPAVGLVLGAILGAMRPLGRGGGAGTSSRLRHGTSTPRT